MNQQCSCVMRRDEEWSLEGPDALSSSRCAMALVHSRFKRVFYAVQRKDFGALGSRWAVHQQDSLNHHYEVYRGLLKTECEDWMRSVGLEC